MAFDSSAVWLCGYLIARPMTMWVSHSKTHYVTQRLPHGWMTWKQASLTTWKRGWSNWVITDCVCHWHHYNKINAGSKNVIDNIKHKTCRDWKMCCLLPEVCEQIRFWAFALPRTLVIERYVRSQCGPPDDQEQGARSRTLLPLKFGTFLKTYPLSQCCPTSFFSLPLMRLRWSL